jgi:hypothetical protein
MNRKNILRWNPKYNADHPWWILREKELGDILRKSKEVKVKSVGACGMEVQNCTSTET